MHSVIIQTKICSPAELDCVAQIDVAAEDCLEHCAGLVVDVGKLPSGLNQEALAKIISDYEKFKYPFYSNLTYPVAMKGNEKNIKFIKLTRSTGFY